MRRATPAWSSSRISGVSVARFETCGVRALRPVSKWTWAKYFYHTARGKCVSHLVSKFVFSRFTLIVYARHLGSTCIRYAYLEEAVHEVLSMPIWWMEDGESGKMEGEGLPVNGSCSENIQEANQTKESAKRIILYHPT